MSRTEKLYNRQMAAAGDWDKDRFNYFAVKASLSKAVAELERIKRGTWQEDLMSPRPPSTSRQVKSTTSRRVSNA